MEGSAGASARVASSWQSSPPRRHMYPFNGQVPISNHMETPPSPRSGTSRRRRVLGRLVRSPSDPRNGTGLTFDADTPDLTAEALPKTPSKRKATAFAKSSKSFTTASTMEHVPAVNTHPPIIRTEDVLPANHSVIRTSSALAMRDVLDSSDEDLDAFDLAIVQTIVPNRRQGHRLPDRFELSNRLRLAEEAKKRHDSVRMLSAVLVSSEASAEDPMTSNGSAERLRYLPLCPASTSSPRSEATNTSLLTVLPSHCNFVQRSQRSEEQSRAVWPLSELPVELFDLITTHLARDDVKSMRLVNREFEQKVSRSLFHTSVVPFNTEIYDMIDEQRKTIISRSPPNRAKARAKTPSISEHLDGGGGGGGGVPGWDSGGLQWQNAKEDKEGKVYKGHGLRVFRGFGPHIKRFGMSFEISENQLSRPPLKKELDHIQSYHGSYDWPSVNYARFATLAGLENTADETSRMKAAFSNLEIVQELALSIDSGLGWLNGPDKSLRSVIFEQPTPVFGSSYPVPDRTTQAAHEFWTALEQSQASFDPLSSLKETMLEYRASSSLPADVLGLRDNIYSNTQLWSAIDSAKVTSAQPNHLSTFGVLYSTANQQGIEVNQKFPLMPGDLNKEQREWLLETQWAQQAFLESYMLAVIDNPSTFTNVTTLNIAKVSSRFLPMLARDVFWEGLPQLSEVILRVSPDWRTVGKDDAGFAQTSNKFPSDAVRFFHREILQARVAPKDSIKKLTIGWVCGGEHAEGMFARNNNILPAPITRLEHCTANSTIFGIVFDHVEHLTLSNCWVTPTALDGLVKSHATKALKKLTLDSVSLTGHPKFPNNLQGVGAQQFAQAMAAMQAQLVNPAAPAQQQGVPAAQQLPGFPQNLNAQQMAILQQQFNQQWQQQFQQLQQQVNANQNNPAPIQNNLTQLGAPAGAGLNNPNNGNTANQANPHWTAAYREGSWPQVIDLISPGPIFNDYIPAPAPWEEPLPERPETNLRAIEFKSCGYVKLPNHTGFDQIVLEPSALHRHSHSAWFRTRYGSLKSAMMTTNDRNIGQIVQYMPWRELNALQLAWGLTEGWEDRSRAEEAEFDGFLPGGTGRFSGVIEKGMALIAQQDASDAFLGDIGI